MTLPAFRYRDRAEQRKKPEPPDGPPFIWTFDIDDTISAAPRQFARLAGALKAAGDKIVCVTGHGPKSTREELLSALAFPFDEIIIVDPEEDGAGKAKVLEHLGSWFHFDNEIAFGPEIIKVCPVTFQFVEPPGDSRPKHDAKKAAKALKG